MDTISYCPSVDGVSPQGDGRCPPRTSKPPNIEFSRSGDIIWTEEMVAIMREDAALGRQSTDTARFFRISRMAVLGKAARNGVVYSSANPVTANFRKRKDGGNVGRTLDGASPQASGREPMPAGHPISWCAIMEHTPSIADCRFEHRPSHFSGRSA